MKKIIFALGFLLTNLRLLAVNPVPYAEAVGFNFKLTGTGVSLSGGGSVTVSDESTSPGQGGNVNAGESTGAIAWLRPGKSYPVTLNGTVLGSPISTVDCRVSYTAPSGYALFINGVQSDLYTNHIATSSSSTSLAGSISIELRPVANFAVGTAGSFSGIAIGKSITWDVALGGLRSGASAGRILFKELDLTNSPASRDRLYYATPANSTQIDIVKDGSLGTTLHQILTPQVFVDISDVSGGYLFSFYEPGFATKSGGVYSVGTHSPWRTIKVESPTNQLKITETEAPTSRVSVLTLTSGTVSTGNYVWTLQEGDGTTPLRTTTHTSSTSTGSPRDDVVVVRTGGATGTMVAKTKYHYVNQTWGGEEVTEVTADPDTAALKTIYDYYTTPSALGNYRQLKSVTYPTGNWASFLYYDDWDKRGQVNTDTRPFQDLPGMVQAASTTAGSAASRNYVADYSGRYRAESSTDYYTTTTGGTYQSGQPRRSVTVGQHRSGNTYNYTLTQTDEYTATGTGPHQSSFSEMIEPVGSGAGVDLNFQPAAVKRPDQTQDSYAYFLGTYSGTTFTESTSGTYFRTNIWHGSTNSSGADTFTTYGTTPATPVSTIYLVPNKSTMDVVIRDPAGLVVRTETHVYTGSGAFSPMTSEDFTYDWAGRLTQRSTSNGATTINTYTGGRLTSAKDPAGTETQFTYDSLGRVSTNVKIGAGSVSGLCSAQETVTTTYTYDGANNVTLTQVQNSTGSPTLTITNSAMFDYAGRQTQQVQFSGSSTNSLTTGYVYSSGGKIVQANLPGGATKISESYLDGQLKSNTGTGIVSEYFSYSVDSTTGNLTAQHQFASTSSPTTTTTTNDWLGRKISFVQPGWNGSTTTQSWFYNTSGQLYKMSQPGLAATLYFYDTLGGLTKEGLDIDGGSGTLDTSSNDRITDHAWTYFGSPGNWWRRETASTYATSTAKQVAKVETQLSGFSAAATGYTRIARKDSYDVYGNVTTNYTEVKSTDKMAVITTDTPDSSTNAVQIVYNGMSVSTTDTVGVQMKYGYDNLGRQNTTTDPRTASTGNTTTTYIANTSLVDSVKDPNNVAQATYTYDSAGRVTSVKDGLTKFTYYGYNSRNQKTREWGQSTFPVEYYYEDSYGRQTAMRTFANDAQGKVSGVALDFTSSTWPSGAGNDLNDNPSTPPAKGNRTLWSFQESTGLLASKTDANGKAVSFTYTQARQPYTRSLARIVSGTTHYGSTNTYSSTTGELTAVTYTDGTTSLGYTYTRLGQLDTVSDCTGSRSFAYNLSGTLELQSETLAASFYGSRRLGYYYDTTGTGTLGRLTLFGLGTSASPCLYQYQDYSYQPDGRLTYTGAYADSHSGQAQGFHYTYAANSHLVQSVADTITQTTPNAQYTDARTYDGARDVVSRRTTTLDSATKADFNYTLDTIGRIQNVTKTGEMFAIFGAATPYGLKTSYGYDDRSEVTSETSADLAGTPVAIAGRTNGTPGFAYDNIGNRTSTTHNGNSATYTLKTNGLNQYDTRVVPGYFDVAGSAPAANTVTVNGSSTGVSRNGQYFFKGQSLSNNPNAVLTTLTVSDGTTTTYPVAFLPGTPESMSYDDDGNLIGDGRWTYLYDAENRLIWMQTSTGAISAGVANTALRYYYDYLGRRACKINYSWSGGTWVQGTYEIYVYRGWNLIQVLESSGASESHFWGLDLSGTEQGAGGVGGLLMTQDGSNNYLPMYDANGNIHGMIKTSDGSIAAAYEYDAFGQTLRESGPYAATNPFRYSTKFTDVETGLVYFGHRYYSPSLGRFINRDPIEEAGGLNLYGFCGNNGVNGIDVLGMMTDEERAYWNMYYKSRYDNTSALNTGYYSERFFDQDDGFSTMIQQGRMGDFAAKYNYLHPFDGNNTPTSTTNEDGSITYSTIFGDFTVTPKGDDFDSSGLTLVGTRLAPRASSYGSDPFGLRSQIQDIRDWASVADASSQVPSVLTTGRVIPVNGIDGALLGRITVQAYELDAGRLNILLGYKDNNSGLTDFNWVQTIRTNIPHPPNTVPFEPYNDHAPGVTWNIPFYYWAGDLAKMTGQNGFTVQFNDYPGRPAGQRISWQAELSLLGRGSQGYQSLITFNWGFTQFGTTVVPADLTVRATNTTAHQNFINQANPIPPTH